VSLRRVAPAAVALAALPAPAAAEVRSIFPSDALTVRDPAQLTGKRVRLPLPNCARRPSDCAELRMVNRLDGFDVAPRIAVRFDRAIRPGRTSRATLSIRPVAGGAALGLDRLVWDPRTRTLTGTPTRALRAGTRYRIRVGAALGGRPATATFTTMSTTAPLARLADRVRAAAPVLRVDAAVPAGTPLQRLVDRGAAASAAQPVVDLSATGAATYVFGSLETPSWLAADRTIAAPPTRRVPPALGRARTSFALIVPAGTPPPSGWPVAVFGHGLFGSHYDVFLTARNNAAAGVATIAVDAVGHGGGPRGAVVAGDTVIPAPGRSADTDGDGTITELESLRTPPQPAPRASLLLRDTLRQTALDIVGLVTALRAGVPTLPQLSRTDIGYYGISLGGMYGTIATAMEPELTRSALIVPGGPIVDVVRLSPGLRPLPVAELAARRPPLATAGRPFDEQLPLRGEPPVTAPTRRALAAQDVIARIRWLTRSGSPDAYSPRLRHADTLLQFAFGDQTVPNPTNDEVVRAGRLEDRAWIYRNDRTPAAATNPHAFLLDPTSPGNLPGQAQALEFIRTGRTIDPDGTANVFEPLSGDLLARLNF
jgi:dienelactone hydrolase